MNALWWFALPVLLLPIWWHRRKRVQHHAAPMASARFLPRTEPRQTRAWRWHDLLLLLARCLLLACLVAWLADPVYPWRGDTVVVTAGADAAWVDAQAAQAGLGEAERVTLPADQALGWLHTHQGEWRGDARLLLLGDVPMPAAPPVFGRRVEVRTRPNAAKPATHHVHIASERAPAWRRMFAAADGPHRIVIDDTPGAATSLLVWDRAAPPPAGLRAPLWLVTDPAAFPELAQAQVLDGMRYADSARGRLWHHPGWPPASPEAARALLDAWQQLHVGPRSFTMPSQVFAASRDGDAPAPAGTLRGILLALLVALFAIERSLAHARRR